MTLAPGTRLGPYEIVGQIGAGGMGEVWKARDPKLDRFVAIKVLPPDFAADADRLRRFQQEARALGALSHPNLVQVFEAGEHEGAPYLVMELLEGETLREKLGGRPLTPKRAAEIAREAALGLSAAHEKGILHRDLKPENLFLTRDGRVKILDFGLAKFNPTSRIGQESATRAFLSEPGTVVGTTGYMSPEQVRGEAVDARSDLFSLGVILWEMVTGARPFKGDSSVEVMHAILKEDPPELDPGLKVPPMLERVLHGCLAKDPEGRFHSAHDLAFALESLSSASGSSKRATASGAPTKHRAAWLWAALAAVAVGAAALFAYREGEKAERRAAGAVTFHQRSFQSQAIFQAAFMPDGETIVYSAALAGNIPELFVVRPEHPEPQPLGLPRTHLLSVSSKGELAVLTNATYLAQRLFSGTLARVSLGGTAPREILEGVRQAAWAPDGSELAIIRSVGGRDRLEFPIGKVLYEAPGYLSDLRISPGGDVIALFEHHRFWDDAGDVILLDRVGQRTVLTRGYSMLEGLVWSGEEVLFSATTANGFLDLYGVDRSGRLRIARKGTRGLTIHDVSRRGRWLVTEDTYASGISVKAPGSDTERDLSILDHPYLPSLSKDGRKVAISDQSTQAGPNYAVCIRDTEGGPVTRLGDGLVWDFSPDGKWVVADVDNASRLVLYPTGPGQPHRLPQGGLVGFSNAQWLQDGEHIQFAANEPGKPKRCYVQDLGGGSPQPVTPEGIRRGLISPEGRRILMEKRGEGWLIQELQGGKALPVPGLSPDDFVIRWGGDGQSVFVVLPTRLPLRFERVDLATGHRDLIREAAAPKQGDMLRTFWVSMTPDGNAYAYDTLRITSRLFVVEGAR